jgi:hypothetical protein
MLLRGFWEFRRLCEERDYRKKQRKNESLHNSLLVMDGNVMEEYFSEKRRIDRCGE